MTELIYTNSILEDLPNWWVKDEDTNNYKFVSSFEVEFTTLDVNLTGFKNSWQVNNATGDELEKIAEKYDLVRNQYDTDDSFRAKIKSYLATLSGKGSTNDIKSIISFFTGLETSDITIVDIRTMVINIDIAITATTDIIILAEIVNIVPNIKAAGVYVLEINYSSSDNIFLSNLSTTNGEDKIL